MKSNKFETGDVVYHQQLVFNDNQNDEKLKRPCIVLFSVEYEKESYTCICPLTTQVKTFNKHPSSYLLVPEIVTTYKKLNFAKLNDLLLCSSHQLHHYYNRVDENTIKQIIDRIRGVKFTNSTKEELKTIRKILDYIILFDEIEQKENNKNKKTLKKQKIKEAKNQSKCVNY